MLQSMTSSTANAFIRLAHLAAILNSTANFFFYYVPWKRFRDAFGYHFNCMKVQTLPFITGGFTYIHAL